MRCSLKGLSSHAHTEFKSDAFISPYQALVSGTTLRSRLTQGTASGMLVALLNQEGVQTSQAGGPAPFPPPKCTQMHPPSLSP